MSWEYKVTIEITIWTKERMSKPQAEQTSIDAVFSNPEGIIFYKRDTLNIEEKERTPSS